MFGRAGFASGSFPHLSPAHLCYAFSSAFQGLGGGGGVNRWQPRFFARTTPAPGLPAALPKVLGIEGSESGLAFPTEYYCSSKVNGCLTTI